LDEDVFLWEARSPEGQDGKGWVEELSQQFIFVRSGPKITSTIAGTVCGLPTADLPRMWSRCFFFGPHEVGLDASSSGQQHYCSSMSIVPVVVAVAVAAAPVETATATAAQHQEQQEQEQATPPPPQNPTVVAETTTRTTPGTGPTSTTTIIQPFFFPSLHTVPADQYRQVLGSNDEEEESIYRGWRQ